MSAIDNIISAFKRFLQFIKGVIEKLVTTIIKWKDHILNWFKNLNLIKGRHIPFITNRQELIELLNIAPTYDTGGMIFTAVYDMETGDINNARVIDGNKMDNETSKQIKEMNEQEGLLVIK